MSAAAQEPTVVSLGTATPGGGFPVYGDAFAATVNALEPGLRVEPRNTKGSTENVPLLEVGRLDLALVQGEVVHESLNGIGRPPADLRILTAMYSTPGMFVVRADAPYRTIADLRGKAVAFGARGSGLVILARYVLDGLGLHQERDFQAVYLDRAGDGPAMVQDGRVAALWGGGTGWPGFTAQIVVAVTAMCLLLLLLVPPAAEWAQWSVYLRVSQLALWIAVGGISYFGVLWLGGLRLHSLTAP